MSDLWFKIDDKMRSRGHNLVVHNVLIRIS